MCDSGENRDLAVKSAIASSDLMHGRLQFRQWITKAKLLGPFPPRSPLSAGEPCPIPSPGLCLTVARKARMIRVYRCLDLPDCLLVRAGNPRTSVRRVFRKGSFRDVYVHG